jgi:hypothetical protein
MTVWTKACELTWHKPMIAINPIDKGNQSDTEKITTSTP